MLKKSILLVFGALLTLGASAETLTPEAALQRARGNKGVQRIIGTKQSQPVLSYTARGSKGEAAVYVFNQADNGGILLVSASNLANPVLGYTDEGAFDPANIPAPLQYWLDEYAAQIEYAEANSIQPKQNNVTYNYPTDWKYIAPLVKTRWNQDNPYDLLTPNKWPTGCVATAMAQVMNFWQYPEIGHGELNYSYEIVINNTRYGETLKLNLEEKPFSWDQMIDNYEAMPYTDEQADAVAYLMQACGYSVEMAYSPYGSGTQVERSGVALIQNFGYDSNIKALQRYGYSATEWAQILYTELTNGRPVIYSGHTLSNDAHAFVADGYDGNGFFHINWGWGGQCDGYYSLDALNPEDQGTGGSAYGGFNFSQGMIVGIQKSEGTPTYTAVPQMTMLGTVNASNTSVLLTMTFTQAFPGNLCNNSMVAILPTIGICMENEATGAKTYTPMTQYSFMENGSWLSLPEMNEAMTMGPGSYIDNPMRLQTRMDANLPNGKYKVTLVWHEKGNEDWKDFIAGNGQYLYFYVTKDGTKFTVQNMNVNRFSIKSAKLLTPLYMRNPFEVEFTFVNPTDVELTQSVVPVLFYQGALSFEGDSQLVTVGPGETLTKKMIYTFGSPISGGKSPTTAQPVDYTFKAYDFNALNNGANAPGYYGDADYGNLGTVTMSRTSTTARMVAEEVTINNYAEEETLAGVGTIYGMNYFGNIVISARLKANYGFIASPVTAVVYTYDPTTGKDISVAYEQAFDNLVYLNQDEVATKTMAMNFREANPGQIYHLVLYYVLSSSRVKLGDLYFSSSSGVEGVAEAGALEAAYYGGNLRMASGAGLETVRVFDLGGSLVSTTPLAGSVNAELNLAELNRGVYIVVVTDAKGESKTLKINR